MADAADKLSIFPDPRRPSKSTPPTADHLIAAEKEPTQQNNSERLSNEIEPKDGSFERLSAMFGGGARFQLPVSGSS